MAGYGANDMTGSITNLGGLSYDQLGGMGITNLANPGVNPWAPVPAGSSSSSSTSSWGTPGTGGGSLPPREAAPTITPFNYSSSATSYPTYMRNLGEQNANRQFESQVNQGIKLGNSVQGYSHAMDNFNNNRLNYMSQAGAADMSVQGQLAAQNQLNNQNALALYGMNVNQRGQDTGYAESLNRLNASGSGSRTITGFNGQPLPRSGDAYWNSNPEYQQFLKDLNSTGDTGGGSGSGGSYSGDPGPWQTFGTDSNGNGFNYDSNGTTAYNTADGGFNGW